MRCLYCDSTINTFDFKSVFIKKDELCPKCRGRLNKKRKIIKVEEMEVETFYEYDGMFKSLLLQYKECMDEALKDVFIYELADYINVRYFNYRICFIPSCQRKLDERGFNHLELMFEKVKLKKVQGLEMKESFSQEGKNLRQRKKMLDNFVYKGEQTDRILLVDDVLTSGSTLLGAYRALCCHTNRIKVLSIAYKKHVALW